MRFALAFSASASASTSALRFNVSGSALSPARRLLWRVGRAGSRLIGSRFVRVEVRLAGFGGSGLGMIFAAVVLISLRSALLAAMFSSRLRSKALMTGSFLGGMAGQSTEIGELQLNEDTNLTSLDMSPGSGSALDPP
jgi:hypothetical protein